MPGLRAGSIENEKDENNYTHYNETVCTKACYSCAPAPAPAPANLNYRRGKLAPQPWKGEELLSKKNS